MEDEKAQVAFHEVQTLRQWHAKIVLAMPPGALLFIAIRQIVFHRPWGHPPVSDSGLVFLTALLLTVYTRLVTVRLVTDVGGRELAVGLRGSIFICICRREQFGIQLLD